MAKKGVKIALAGAAALTAALGATAVTGFRIACVRKKTTPEQDRRRLDLEEIRDCRDEMADAIDWFLAQDLETVTIRSRDGLKLYGSYLEAPNARGCMLLCHGYRSWAPFDFGLVLRRYHEAGLSILLIDQRSHGRSEGKYISFGVLERYDVQQWTWYLHAKLGGRIPVLLDGMSMGAATVMMASNLELAPSVVGIIADCGYNSPWEQLRYSIRSGYKLPTFPTLQLTNLMCRLVGGFDLKSISSAEALANSRLPLLICHGTADLRVPAAMTAENFAAATAEDKTQWLVEGATHGMSYWVDHENMDRELMAFIDRQVKRFHGA